MSLMLGRIYDATYGRLFAAGYDWLLAGSERAGLADMRKALLAHAHGVTLEIGAGTGTNLPYYPGDVDRLVLTEPSQHMARKLGARAHSVDGRARVVRASAEHVPVVDASMDTVVATLVLCSVENPSRTLSEVARVLRPDGRLLFLEHVRSRSADLAARQDRWEPVWRFFGAGCRCNRPTEDLIAAAPLTIDTMTRGEMPKVPSIVQPLISGTARRTPSVAEGSTSGFGGSEAPRR